MVTAPQSQAKPTILVSSGSIKAITLKIKVGKTLIKIIGFKLQPRKNLTVPRTAAKPTPSPTSKTVAPERSFKRVNRYGAFSGSTIDPATCNAPIAGSAKVTPIPNKNAIHKTPGNGSLRGKVLPMISPNGISPSFNPSINIIKPIMTANNPPAIMLASITGVCSTRY